MYITVTIPAIRTVVTPVEGVDTREDQIEALRVLSAGNTLIIVLLGGVLALQVRETAFLCCGERSTDHTIPSLSLPFFFFLGSSRTQGGPGMGAEIGNEGSGENCGRGREGKRRCEEGSVTCTNIRNDAPIYSYCSLTVCLTVADRYIVCLNTS
jgi:ER membrane protein SH3